jgi:hypothetical protein
MPRDFPPGVLEVFDRLWEEVVHLHFAWHLYQDLYGDPAYLATLSDTAPGAFRLIEVSIRHSLVMAFGRLVDPSMDGKNENLSLRRLLDLVKPHCGQAFYDGLHGRMEEIRAHLQPLTKLRHKTVAHTDLTTALSPDRDPIPNPTRPHVTRATELIAGLMNEVDKHFRDNSTPYGFGGPLGAAKDLLECLRLGLEARKEEQRRWFGQWPGPSD